MPEPKEGKPMSKSVSLEAITRMVRDAFHAQFSKPSMPQEASADSYWPREIFDDKIVVEGPDGMWAYPYTLDDDGVTFGEPKKVEIDYKPAKSVAVKFLREEDGGAVVGGHIALWGDPEHKDLQDDYFTPETWLGLDEYPTVPALFHHGLDDTIGASVIGKRIKAGVDDTGAWVEDWLDKSGKYWAMVKPLLAKEALYYSPGSAPHLVKREEDGKLKSYPIVEDTLTVIPAQHRLRPVEQIKAAYKAAGLDYPLEDEAEDLSGDDGGPSCEDKADEIERVRKANENALAILELEILED